MDQILTKAEFSVVNRHRCRLIDKQAKFPLSEKDAAKLDRLQEACGEWVHRQHPLPKLDDEVLDALEQRAAGRQEPEDQ